MSDILSTSPWGEIQKPKLLEAYMDTQIPIVINHPAVGAG